MLTRREELDNSAKSIEELIQVLDMRKDEAIERTFKQVAKNFEEVFEKLVPAGKGRLIIQRQIDQVRAITRPFLANAVNSLLIFNLQDEDDAEEELEDTQRSSVDNYTGVSIKARSSSRAPNAHLTCAQVSFNSKVDEGLRIQQLSGGQKSLVALATGTVLWPFQQNEKYNLYSQSLQFKSVIPLHFIFSMRYD